MKRGKLFTDLVQQLVIALLFLVVSCKTPTPTQDMIPNVLYIKSLESVNLSEDMHEVSTKEDEIVLLSFLFDLNDSTYQLYQSQVFDHRFTRRGEVALINQSYQLSSVSKQAKIIFFLIELDNDIEVDSVKKIIVDELATLKMLSNVKETCFKDKLGHDDLLGLLEIDIKHKSRYKHQFSGLQLFDRYEYLLSLDFQ